MYRDTSRINEYKVIACLDSLCMVNTKELVFSSKPRSPSPCPAPQMPPNLRCCPPTSQPGNPRSDALGRCCWLHSSHHTPSTATPPWNGSMITFPLGWAHAETQGTNLHGVFYWFLALWLAEPSQ